MVEGRREEFLGHGGRGTLALCVGRERPSHLMPLRSRSGFGRSVIVSTTEALLLKSGGRGDSFLTLFTMVLDLSELRRKPVDAV
jgi:hypothetical protein